MRTLNKLPILSTIPRSGTWFLRYAISFLCHLDRGGRIDDRLTGKIVGNPFGRCFDFQAFNGGPLFRVAGTMPTDSLFIGHTVCPGFGDLAGKAEWWSETDFHVPGYDYLHEGMDYRYTPVELAEDRYAPIDVPALEKAAGKGRGPRVVLVYRNPVDQARSYLRYCREHRNPNYNVIRGRPITSVSFHDYLFGGALASYAKQFISFQVQARRYPELVRLIPYERLIKRPVEILTVMLDHLSGAPRDWERLPDAVRLARRDHMKAIEKELGRSLDGTLAGRGSHMRQADADTPIDAATRDEAEAFLQNLGIDTDLLEWPAVREARVSA
jgi:hypothetical protein